MIHKKLAVSFVACALMFTVGGNVAFACTKTARTTKLPHCTVEDCNTMKTHWHDGVRYCGHSLDDGCEWHVACDVDGCNLTYAHEHDGVICMGHCSTDGHDWHTVTSHHSSRHCGSGHGCH